MIIKQLEEFQKLYTEFQTLQADANTPESIKERRMQEIQERHAKIEQFSNTAQQDLQRLQQTLAAPIVQKVQDAVKAVGAEGAYTMVFPNAPDLLLYTGTVWKTSPSRCVPSLASNKLALYNNISGCLWRPGDIVLEDIGE